MSGNHGNYFGEIVLIQSFNMFQYCLGKVQIHFPQMQFFLLYIYFTPALCKSQIYTTPPMVTVRSVMNVETHVYNLRINVVI